jgi:hypothetical protein
MALESSVKSVIFRDTPNASNTGPNSFVEQEYGNKYMKPPMPGGAKNLTTMYGGNKLSLSKQALSIYDVSPSGSFTQKDMNPQSSFASLRPDSSKGIKASIGGEEFVMYRTNDTKCNDENDSVEIEMHPEEYIQQVPTRQKLESQKACKCYFYYDL